jgi:poly-gamma-glutamate synthesis protein (capsule biosynthesis protein)
MVDTPPPRFQSFARAAIEMGFDIVHGHSAHVFQGVEPHGRGLILYDTGDFLDDYAVDPELRNDWSFIFQVETGAQGLARLRMTPVRLRFARVDLADGREAEAIKSRMIRRCESLEIRPAITQRGLELRLGD